MGELEKLRRQVAELTAKINAFEEREKALQESEKRHRLINELVSDRIYAFVVKPGGEVELCDPVLGVVGGITGYGLEETRKFEDWSKVIHPDDWPKAKEGMKMLFAGKRCEVEVRLVSKSGEVTWHNAIGVPDWDAGENRLKGGYWCIKDITAQKRAEEEMVRLEKLRALGQMAAGISHNLNNILTTIMGPAKLLERQVTDPELKTETEYIVRSARRARDLVRRLNEAVAGAAETDIRAVPVNKTVREAADLTRPIWKDQSESRGVEIRVKTKLGDVPPIRGTRSGMVDIVVNLILNAVDALPSGGEIEIRTEQCGDGVLLAVKDSGVGMDDETQKRVFEPFFTTKSEIGTGLGLSTVFGTVARWGGSIGVESSPGRGAEFTIRLPAGGEAEVEGEGSARSVECRRARILVVEDVEAIRTLLSRTLSPRHDVTCVPDGGQALEALDSGGYDVAIIDLGLSRIPGDAVGRMLRQADPAIATILISGWELTEADPRIKGFDFRISKPFDDLADVEHLVAEAVRLRDSRSRDSD